MPAGSTVSSGSKSPPLGSVPAVLYESKGLTPPESVQKLKYLEIEFQSPKLRQNFVNLCHDAHHPGLRQHRRGTLGSEADSIFRSYQTSVFLPGASTISQATTPQIGTAELDGAGLGLGMTGPANYQLPSPALARSTALTNYSTSLPSLNMLASAVGTHHELYAGDTAAHELDAAALSPECGYPRPWDPSEYFPLRR
ncbi:hypothetical protein F5Y16DRAFT_166254 [Xylariaceae sp. FL0255]|nr:hypothetical protein F5Y16DRAFT_166254 [Xylariaceae sp. FL0255]